MSNFDIYRKIFTFLIMRFFNDAIGFVLFIFCGVWGYYISGNHIYGAGLGSLLGLILLLIFAKYLNYIYKAGQIAITMHGVSENKLPKYVTGYGLKMAKKRFPTSNSYFTTVNTIKSVFSEIGSNLNKVPGSDDEEHKLTGIVDTIVAYLRSCCLGWVMYQDKQSINKSICEGAEIFYKNGYDLLKNLVKLFWVGTLSLITIGGSLGLWYYYLLEKFPRAVNYVLDIMINFIPELSEISSMKIGISIVAVFFAIISWIILHNCFVRPYILINVLRNYMHDGMLNMPNEHDLNIMDNQFSHFKKLHSQLKKD
jgi:hypothetical protein